MTLYTIYDNEGKFYCEYHESQPNNSTTLLYTGDYIEPRFNPVTQTFYEAATLEQKEEAVEVLRKEYEELIHNHIWIYTEKKSIRDAIGEPYEIPVDVINEYNRLRAEYQQKKAEILAG